MTMYEAMNMKLVNAEENEQLENGAILKCSRSWTSEQITNWLPMISGEIECIETVKNWLDDDAQISESGFLKVWFD